VIVLRNGKNVYPQEIEKLINRIPYLLESLVYQRAQSKTDTMLCAKIVYDETRIKEGKGGGRLELGKYTDFGTHCCCDHFYSHICRT